MANTTAKKTIRSQFEELLAIEAVSANADLVEFINSRIAQLDKKSASKGGERKPTAKQIANEAIKEAIIASMGEGVAYTATQMLKEFDCFDEATTSQKVNALLKQLVESGKVVRSEEGKKAYFTVA